MTDAHTPASETGIETAGTYYQNWVSFTKLSTYVSIAIVILLAVMAATLV